MQTSTQIRNENYYNSAENHVTQNEMILKALPILYVTVDRQIKRGCSTASRIRKYLITANYITEKTPITSIRRALNNLHAKNKITVLENVSLPSIEYGGTETVYRFNFEENYKQETIFNN